MISAAYRGQVEANHDFSPTPTQRKVDEKLLGLYKKRHPFPYIVEADAARGKHVDSREQVIFRNKYRHLFDNTANGFIKLQEIAGSMRV